jgi:hypothetical protein
MKIKILIQEIVYVKVNYGYYTQNYYFLTSWFTRRPSLRKETRLRIAHLSRLMKNESKNR